jgi:hypothetical protein
MYIGLHVKYSLFLPDFNETWIFFDSFSKNCQISNLMEIYPMRAELYQADGRTDMTKLTVAYQSSAKAPKISDS